MSEPTVLSRNIAALRAHLGQNQERFAEEVGSAQANVSKWESKGIVPGGAPLAKMAELAERTIAQFIDEPWRPARGAPARPSKPAPDLDMVGIQSVDADFGMGGAYSDSHVDVEVLQFPKLWVETITHSPAELLTWARGKGDSMFPTIADGDLILIDRSKRKVEVQDEIWAFLVGEVRSIKRLRVKGDRYQILSDNPAVPMDEEPQDFVTIVGRVSFVGSKK